MRVIDLLNKIANKEEVPKKIKYKGREFRYNILDNDYVTIKKPNDVINLFITWSYELNDEVEIIEVIEEDKEIELLDVKVFHNNQLHLANKINELINGLNKLNNKVIDIVNELNKK